MVNGKIENGVRHIRCTIQTKDRPTEKMQAGKIRTDQGLGLVARAASYATASPGYVPAYAPMLFPLPIFPPFTLIPLHAPNPFASVGTRLDVTSSSTVCRSGPWKMFERKLGASAWMFCERKHPRSAGSV